MIEQAIRDANPVGALSKGGVMATNVTAGENSWQLTVTLSEHERPSIAVSVFGHLNTDQVGVLSDELATVRAILDGHSGKAAT